jgi:hypothetical protein
MREIAFYDEGVGLQGPIRRFRRQLGLVPGLFGLSSVYEIPVSGRVINRQFASRMPSFDRLWNVPDLFQHAHRAFLYFRRELSVTHPATKPPSKQRHSARRQVQA